MVLLTICRVLIPEVALYSTKFGFQDNWNLVWVHSKNPVFIGRSEFKSKRGKNWGRFVREIRWKKRSPFAAGGKLKNLGGTFGNNKEYRRNNKG